MSPQIHLKKKKKWHDETRNYEKHPICQYTNPKCPSETRRP